MFYVKEHLANELTYLQLCGNDKRRDRDIEEERQRYRKKLKSIIALYIYIRKY